MFSSSRFCFAHPEEKKEIALPNSTIMRIQRESIATASIRFLQNGLPVEAPNGLSIKDETNDEIITTIAYNREKKYFILPWKCSFTITLNDKEIVSLANNREWNPEQYVVPPEERFWNISVPR